MKHVFVDLSTKLPRISLQAKIHPKRTNKKLVRHRIISKGFNLEMFIEIITDRLRHAAQISLVHIIGLAQKIPVFLSSSSEVYGKNTSDSLKESDDRVLGSPVTLRWSYSEAKAIDESLAYAYWVEKKLETRIVRFFNTVGPRQLGAYGMVVPRFVQFALRNEPITIYGDGEQTRCFGHVLDAVDAVVRIAFAENTIGKVINIGNDYEISINDLAKKVIEQTNSKSEIVYVPYEEAYGDGFEDMERRVPNIELIKSLVGWEPKRDLSTMIADIAKFLK